MAYILKVVGTESLLQVAVSFIAELLIAVLFISVVPYNIVAEKC